MSVIEQHLDLFKLDWLREPSAALKEGRKTGISDPHFIEMSAWCAELHAQLADLAEERGLPLLLMGGNATALRLEAAKQRGSRDNDYLTTASDGDIRKLMNALVARFAEHFQAPLFRYRELTGPPDSQPLPLVAFAVHVPALLDRNATDGQLSVKLEFHTEDDPDLFPETETVSGRFFALAQDVAVVIPKLPYQIALKLMTLHEPPVGIDVSREDAIPRQLYDLDLLLAQLDNEEQWHRLTDYARRRYDKEERQRGRSPADDGPWASIARRLDQWAHADDPVQRYGQLIRTFQASQVSTGTKRPPEQWRGRARRLQFMVRCAALEDGYERAQRALAIETRIDEPAKSKLKTYRNAISEVTGIAPRKLGQFPRVPYWEFLATAQDLDAALDSLDSSLSVAGSS